MFKLLKRLICLGIILAIVFVTLTFLSGGKWFRWFGDTVKKTSDDAAQKADKIKDAKESVTGTVKNTVQKTTDIIDKKEKGK